MGRGTASFRFDFAEGYRRDSGAFVASVPPGLTTKEELLSALNSALRFPPHFGMNWDALYDCLGDFSWIEQETIVLLHQDVPALGRDDLRTYLEILDDSLEDWKSGEEHRLVVVFPEEAESQLSNLQQGN